MFVFATPKGSDISKLGKLVYSKDDGEYKLLYEDTILCELSFDDAEILFSSKKLETSSFSFKVFNDDDAALLEAGLRSKIENALEMKINFEHDRSCGTCSQCSNNNLCLFFAVMMKDLSFFLIRNYYPSKFNVHLQNSISLFKAGIMVTPIDEDNYQE